jgi:protein disulfide-isomerase A6
MTDEEVEFVETHASTRSTRPPSKLTRLTPLSFPKFVDTPKCLMVLFHTTFGHHHKNMQTAFNDLADVFDPEPNVSIGSVNCEKFRELCDEQHITEFPVAKFSLNRRWAEYDGPPDLVGFVCYLNHECGTEREVDGLLKDKAGTITAADQLVIEFVKTEAKADVLQKVKEIQGPDI